MRPDLRPSVVRDLAADAFEAATSVDGKLVRTLRALATRPGELTAAFLRGARNRYVTAIQTFLLANVVFFVVQGWLDWNTLRTPLRIHVTASFYKGWAKQHVQALMAERGVTFEALADAFDARVETYSKSLLILMVPMYAAGVRIACRSRAGVLAAVVFALHFYAAYLWLEALLILPVAKLLSSGALGRWSWESLDAVMGVVLLALLTAYQGLALRAAFGFTGGAAAVRAFALTATFAVSFLLYRFLIFLIVLHTLPDAT